MPDFARPRLKIERAKKHINDINSLLLAFSSSDFYTVTVEKNTYGANFLRFDVDKSPFPINNTALLIGDALHNLRSALDLLYYEISVNHTKWSRFPVLDTRDELERRIKTTFEKKQISVTVHGLLLNSIKPYKTGNFALWALDDLNIRDKHQLLIPVLKFMGFAGICLEDDKHVPLKKMSYFLDESSLIRLPSETYRRNLTVTDKGHAAAAVYFDLGIPFEGEAVIPALYGVAEEVTRTVEAFEIALAPPKTMP